MTYQDSINAKAKRLRASVRGINLDESDIHPALYPFQRAITRRALQLGSAALFEDCGMGKTIQELEWARHVTEETGKPVLVFAPLAVGPQMVKEGRLIDYPVKLARRQSDVSGPVVVTNYEMMQHFTPQEFGGLVLDESSILKNQLGKMRGAIVDFASRIPYKLAATATPAPNDLPELLNHASYLGIMSVKEALALFFTQDGNSTQNWRLKGHAVKKFWQWVGTWAIAARTPDDLGMPMPGYDLPELHVVNHEIAYDAPPTQGTMFQLSVGIADMRRIRRGSLDARASACADLVNGSNEPWVVWCELNDESSALTAAIPGAVEIRGSDSIERKTSALTDFSNGAIRVLVTKPSIAGHGLNWQHCSRMAFVGASYSYEMQYQAVRRCWRYGQQREVMVHRFATDADMFVIDAVAQKEQGQDSLYDNIPWQLHVNGHKPASAPSGDDVAHGNGYTLHLGDSVQTIDQIETESVGLSVFSPPFPGMYVYTDSSARHGQCRQHRGDGGTIQLPDGAEQDGAGDDAGEVGVHSHHAGSGPARQGWLRWAERFSRRHDSHDGGRRLDLLRRGNDRQESAGQGNPHQGRRPNVQIVGNGRGPNAPGAGRHAAAIQETRSQPRADTSGQIREIRQHYGMGDE